MTLTAPSDDGCKGRVSGPSRTKRLPPVGSYPAAALAVGFFLVTCFVLFKDVADGAPITPDHVMSMAVLIGTFASGHLLWGQLQQWRLLPALGLMVLFAGGTFYCVTASGGRNATVQSVKAGEAHKTNDDRARVEADLSEAKERLDASLEGEEAECASGDGIKCKARRTTRQERQTYVNVLEAQLRLMDPQQIENPELRHAAKLFAAMPGVMATEDRIFASLVLFFPFVKALFCEIATLVFASIGFRHGPGRNRSQTVRNGDDALEPSQSHASFPQSHSTVPFQKAEALRDVLSLIHSSGTVPSQGALRLRWKRPKSTVSRWLIEFEAKGQITRSQQGKCKAVNSRPVLVR